MVYKFPLCLCGGSMTPTDKPFCTSDGTGRIYKCNKCGKEDGVIEGLYC